MPEPSDVSDLADVSDVPGPTRSDDRPARRALVIYALVAVLFIGGAIGLSRMLGASEGVDHTIVIPDGTAERIAAGETVELIPADLRFQLRDRLIVVNNDHANHQVGPFTVAAGQRLEKRFSEAATLEGSCSLHPSGNITIEIGGSTAKG